MAMVSKLEIGNIQQQMKAASLIPAGYTSLPDQLAIFVDKQLSHLDAVAQ